MREDTPHPDKRKSLRVVLESSPAYSRGFSRNLKRDSLRSPSSLPGASRDGLGLTVVSLPCPKGCIFWCESWGRERTQNIRKAAGVDNGLRRLRRGCFAPFNPIPDAHTPGKRRAKKKSAANVTKGWHIYPPVIYCICWRATRFFDWPSGTTLPLFAPPRSTGLVFPVSAGFVNLPANVFSYVSPCSPSAPFVKKTTSQKVDIRRLRWYNKITKSTRGFAPERKVGMSCKCCGCTCHEHTTDTDAYMFSEEYAQKMAEISADTEATPISLHGHIVCEVHPDEDIRVLAAELSSLID